MTVTERLLEQLKKEKYKIEAIYRKPLPVKTYICEEEVRGRSETDAVLSFYIINKVILQYILFIFCICIVLVFGFLVLAVGKFKIFQIGGVFHILFWKINLEIVRAKTAYTYNRNQNKHYT